MFPTNVYNKTYKLRVKDEMPGDITLQYVLVNVVTLAMKRLKAIRRQSNGF